MKEARVMGLINVDILQDDGKVFEKFENAYRYALKNYIEPTAMDFNPDSLSFEKKDGEIRVEYRFEGMGLKYEIGESETLETGSSRYFEADFGRGLFEYLAKFVVVTFLEDQLSVKSVHTQVAYSGFRMSDTRIV